MDSMEADQVTSSLLDDVFFVVKKCISRATSSQAVDGICAVINNACSLLESEFLRVLQETVAAGLPSTYLDQAYSVLHSKLSTATSVSDSDKSRQQFLACLNNCEAGMEYITRLQTQTEADLSALQQSSTMTPMQSEKVASCLLGLPGVQASLQTTLSSGLAALRAAAVKPRVKPWVDAFSSVSLQTTLSSGLAALRA